MRTSKQHQASFDEAATKRVLPEVVKVMEPYYSKLYHNPSSDHACGQTVKAKMNRTIAKMSKWLNVAVANIVITSGATESNNHMIAGTVFSRLRDGGGKPEIWCSDVEHKCILETIGAYEQMGLATREIIPVDRYGCVDVDEFETRLHKARSSLVTVQGANNELGSINDVEKIAAICEKNHVPFHCDAVQLIAWAPLPAMGHHFTSVSGHKIGGPKGIGLLVLDSRYEISPFIFGGSQQNGKRAGTIPTAQVVGIAKAIEIAIRKLPIDAERVSRVRNRFETTLLSKCDARINGHPTKRLPGFSNLTFLHVDPAELRRMVRKEKLCVAFGAACSSQFDGEISHVLRAIGLNDNEARATIRVSFSPNTTISDAEDLAERLSYLANRTRYRTKASASGLRL